MRYPSGFLHHVLWGFTLLICFGLALLYKVNGLAIDWLIVSALLIWHLRAGSSRAKR